MDSICNSDELIYFKLKFAKYSDGGNKISSSLFSVLARCYLLPVSQLQRRAVHYNSSDIIIQLLSSPGGGQRLKFLN